MGHYSACTVGWTARELVPDRKQIFFSSPKCIHCLSHGTRLKSEQASSAFDMVRAAPDDGQGNCPKHVVPPPPQKNKFEKLVHLVGFIIRIYHDAQSPDRQIRQCQTDNGNISIKE